MTHRPTRRHKCTTGQGKATFRKLRPLLVGRLCYRRQNAAGEQQLLLENRVGTSENSWRQEKIRPVVIWTGIEGNSELVLKASGVIVQLNKCQVSVPLSHSSLPWPGIYIKGKAYERLRILRERRRPQLHIRGCSVVVVAINNSHNNRKEVPCTILDLPLP